MDRDRFDTLTRVLATTGSRRRALAALLGTSLAGMAGLAEARNRGKHKDRKNKQRKRQARRRTTTAAADVTAQATCATPESGSNLSGCNYTGRTFSDADLHGSRMVGTIFTGARLQGADLHGSTLTGAIFRNANLCGADLSSSALRNADFRGANLANTDLRSSSGCTTIITDAATVFCNTTMCTGTVRNDDCTGGQPAGACCSDADCANPCKQRCSSSGTCVPNGNIQFVDLRFAPSDTDDYCVASVAIRNFPTNTTYDGSAGLVGSSGYATKIHAGPGGSGTALVGNDPDLIWQNGDRLTATVKDHITASQGRLFCSGETTVSC